AVAEFLAKHDPSEITARLDQVYDAQPSTLDPALRRAQRRSIAQEAW
ncbi:MAG: ChpI protein, partial [Gemmatimonadetes bacterium]|nr:ChpI protein [Gemmatimonadota bacterium]